MYVKSIIIFILMTVGILLLFDLSPRAITEIVMEWLSNDKKDIRSIIKRAGSDKKQRGNPLGYIKKNLLDAQSVLIATSRGGLFSTLIVIATILFFAGFIFGLVVNNIALSLVLSFGFGMLPFWYIKVTEINLLKEFNEDLQTTLSVVSDAYDRTKNFRKAVEENLYQMNPPVSNVFEEFIFEITYVSPDMKRAILNMSEKIDNAIFREWCRNVLACQDNPNLIPILDGIVSKLTDVIQKTSDLEVKLAAPRRDIYIVGLVCLSIYPLYYVIHYDWFWALIGTYFGKIWTAIGCLLIFFVLSKSVDQTRPIEYED